MRNSLLAILLASSTATPALAQYTTTVLHPAAGYYNSVGRGISGGGQVGYATSLIDDQHHALVWSGTAGSVIDLHPMDFPQSEALAVSGGQQVGRVFDSFSSQWHAFSWGGSAATGLDLNPVGFGGSEARDTNGTFQVGWGNPAAAEGHHALLWRGSHSLFTDLHPTFCDESYGMGISPGSIQVGFGTGAFGIHAIRWSGSSESAADIHPAGYTQSQAFDTDGIQHVGSVVTAGVTHAGLWIETGSPSFIDLHPAGLSQSEASAVAGGIQVGSGGGPWGFNSHALLWTGSASSMLDLHAFLPPGFFGSVATGINPDGNIVGTAHDGALTYAVIWTVPAPGTAVLLGAAGVLLGSRRRS